MQEALRDYIENTFKIFDQYQVTDPSLLQEIADLRQKYVDLANKTGDFMAFIQAAPSEGLYEAFTEVSTRIVMKQNQQQAAENPTEVTKLPTVGEYLAQYESAYNEVKKDPRRARAIAAYERLFNVKNRTNDLLNAQIIIEKEQMLFQLSYWDSLDIFENRLREMDPLYKVTTATLLNSIEAVRKSASPEEMYYQTAIHEVKSLYDATDYYAKMLIVIHLATRLTEYCNAKRDFYGNRDKSIRRGHAMAMMNKRAEIRKILAFSERFFHLSFESLMNDEGLKIWLLNPQTTNDDKVGLSRTKEAMHPQNYEVFTDLIENEIRPEKTLAELLSRRPEKVFWYKL